MKATLKSITILISILIILGSTLPSMAQLVFSSHQAPTPPDQPTDGPGGSNYSHKKITCNRYGWGASQYWIFEPSDPTPSEAPVVIFLHGWSAMFPLFYQPWIDHLVKRGNIVIYPRYQRGIYFGFERFDDNAIQAVRHAFEELQDGTHVSVDKEKVAVTGHSLGGGFTVLLASEATNKNLPIPKALMPVQPGIRSTETINYSAISNETLLLVIVGEDDTVVGDQSGKQIFYATEQIPLHQKDFIIQKTDTYGTPHLLADHMAPVCLFSTESPTVDAMDYYSTWKLFDALTDYAFYGRNRQYCLGNTTEQRFMGLWSDGTPVQELIVTDTP